jgi:hypothetical protein
MPRYVKRLTVDVDASAAIGMFDTIIARTENLNVSRAAQEAVLTVQLPYGTGALQRSARAVNVSRKRADIRGNWYGKFPIYGTHYQDAQGVTVGYVSADLARDLSDQLWGSWGQ